MPWDFRVVHFKQVFHSNCVQFNKVPLYIHTKVLPHGTGGRGICSGASNQSVFFWEIIHIHT